MQVTPRTKTGGRKAGTPNRPRTVERASVPGAPDPAVIYPLKKTEPPKPGLGESGPAFPPYRLARLADLIPNERNARTHTPESIDALCRQITANGWTAPMLVAGRHILAGHRRRLAGLKLALDTVPVIDLSHLSANERRAYILWDNKSVISGSDWDTELLSLELSDLRDAGFDLSLSGFDAKELASLFDDADPAPAPDDATGDLDGKVCCPSCGHEFQTVAKAFRLIAGKKTYRTSGG